MAAPPPLSATSTTGTPAVPFAQLPGWADDDHGAAFQALLTGADVVLARTETPPALAAIYRTAMANRGTAHDRAAARTFFETWFTARPVNGEATTFAGLLTGYYEPILDGSPVPSAQFPVALHRRPPDLVNVVSESARGTVGGGFTHLRRRADGGTEPYPTREDIERGALDALTTADGALLAFLFLACPVDTFLLHVQGSGAIRLPDGRLQRVTYDGKNGHPYTSVGREMITDGLFPAEALTLDTMTAWLKAHPDRARSLLWRNRSYVFFRPLDAEAPVGVMDSPLVPGRSLAVDTAHHALGTPVQVISPSLSHVGAGGLARLMIAHDVGSAITGPERGDVFFGTGPDALALAGITKHACRFAVLQPRGASDGG